MDDPGLVTRFKRLRDLLRDGDGFLNRGRTFLNPFRERRSLDEFEHERLHAVGVFEPVDARDVRMVELRNGFCFSLKSGFSLGVLGKVTWKDLDGDRSLEACVLGLVDLSHTSSTYLGHDLVRAECVLLPEACALIVGAGERAFKERADRLSVFCPRCTAK